MSTSDESRVRFSELENDEVPEYAPVSVLAICSLLLGLASMLGLFHPLFSVISLAAAALSLHAMRRIQSSEPRPTGMMLAWIGLGVALFCGPWSVSKEYTRQRVMYGHARQFAEEWLGLLRDKKVYEAHQLYVDPDMRAARSESLETHYAPKEKPDMASMRAEPGSSTADRTAEMMEMMAPGPHERLQQFLDSAEGKRIAGLGENWRFEFDSQEGLSSTRSLPEWVNVVYRLSGQGAAADSFRLKIELERRLDSAIADWRVAKISVVK